jgi:hypothetical protein
MNRLKWLINMAVATVVGSLVSAGAEKVLGPWGMILGFIVGGVAGWWVAQRYVDF